MTSKAKLVVFFGCLIALIAHSVGNYETNTARAGNTFFKGSSPLKIRARPTKIFLSKSFNLFGKRGFFPPAPPPPPPRYVNVKTFGATGNGTTDDQAAIVNAVRAAEAQGFPVYFPSGVYVHSDTIASATAFFGDGFTSYLLESAAPAYAVVMQGDHSGITNMVVSGGVKVTATNFLFDHVTLTNSPTNGIEVASSSVGTISYVECSNNANSGLSIWDSSNLYIHDNTFKNNGQYALRTEMQSKPNKSIGFFSNTVQGDAWLHGVQWFTFNTNSVVGRLDIQALASGSTIEDFVEIASNMIDGQTFGPQSSVPGLTISGMPFQGFGIQKNTISNFQYCVCVTNVSRATFGSDAFTNAAIDLIRVSGYQQIAISGETLQNAGRSAIHIQAAGGGISMFSNQISNCCATTPGAVIDVVYQSGANTASIVNNVYSGAANQAQYFVSCTIPGSASNTMISGNSGGVLPNLLAP